MRWRHRAAYPILLLLGVLDAAGYSIIAPVSPQILIGPLAGGAVAEVFGFGGVGLVALIGGGVVLAMIVRVRRSVPPTTVR